MDLHFYLMANFTIFRKLLMQRLAGTGLTPGQPKILDYLSRHDGAMQTEIAAACYLEGASLTSALNGMGKKGLIERRRAEGDRRAYHIYLTAYGRQMAVAVEECFAQLEKELLAELPRELAGRIEGELGQVYDVLDGKLKSGEGKK